MGGEDNGAQVNYRRKDWLTELDCRYCRPGLVGNGVVISRDR